MKRCMYCGHVNEDSATVCEKCGNRLLDIPTSEIVLPPQNGEQGEVSGQAQNTPGGSKYPGVIAAGQEATEGAARNVSDMIAAGQAPADYHAQQPDENGLPGQTDYEGGQSAAEASDGSGYEQNGQNAQPAYTDGAAQTDYVPGGDASGNQTASSQSGPAAGSGYDGGGYGYAPEQGYEQGGAYEQNGYNAPDMNGAGGYGQNGYGPQGSYEGGGSNAQGMPYGAAGGYDPQGYYGQGQYDQNGYGYGQQARPEAAGADGAGSYSSGIMHRARKAVRSPLLFLAAVFFTISVLAEILNVVLGNALTNISTVSNTINQLTGENVAVSFMNSIVNLIMGINPMYLMGAGLIAAIPSVFLMFGVWMAWGATSDKKEEVSTGGYTMSKFAIILKFIGVCIVLLAMIVFSVAFVVSAGAASSMMSLIAGIIVLLILVLITVFAILYYIQVLYGIKVVRNNVRDGQESGAIPGFAIFIGFLGCLATVAAMLPMAPDDYIGLASRGAYAAWLLFLSIWALVYRAKVRRNR